MTLNLQELETLLILVRERHGYVCEHTQAPQTVRDKLVRLENKLLAAMLAETDDEEVGDTANDGLRGPRASEGWDETRELARLVWFCARGSNRAGQFIDEQGRSDCAKGVATRDDFDAWWSAR